MPSEKPLKDPKSEKLAFGIGFAGVEYAAAAQAAGYVYKTAASAQAGVGRRLRDGTFKERVQWWREERERQEAEKRERSADMSVVDEAWVIEGLKNIHTLALAGGDLSNARAALVDLGKTKAMFVDKSINQNESIDRMTDDRLIAVFDEARKEREDGKAVH